MTPAGTTAGSRHEVNWEELTAAAGTAMACAYAPYSGFPVGVAALVDDGRVISGCNVENASFGLTLCAECGLVSELHRTGGGRLRAVVCVDHNHDLLMPCGRCRQLLWEHGGPDCLLLTPLGVQPMSTVMPQAFDVDDLTQRTQRKPDTKTQDPA